jgi:hypothetical protein
VAGCASKAGAKKQSVVTVSMEQNRSCVEKNFIFVALLFGWKYERLRFRTLIHHSRVSAAILHGKARCMGRFAPGRRCIIAPCIFIPAFAVQEREPWIGIGVRGVLF